MLAHLDPTTCHSIAAGLLGGIDVDGGPTPEQRTVFDALARHSLGLSDADLAGLTPIDAATLAERLPDPAVRRRFHHLHVALETCRHPQTPAQVRAVEEYADALGTSSADRSILRALVDEGAERAAADYRRYVADALPRRSEPGLRTADLDPDAPEPELTSRLAAFADLDEGSLGRAYLAFYERNHLDLPGAERPLIDHFYVAHDMTHVIAGMGTTAAAEIALSAFMVGMDGNDVNFSALVCSLMIHEAGVGVPTSIAHAEENTLASPAAADLLARELRRGSECTGDFSLVDHFALAPLPLAEVRARFGVRPPDDPDDGHHVW
ncbi:MAG: hypothetical protein RLZZ467_1198 [Gemmatimonadota bacterium]